jgi:hypothetical protein
MGATRRKFTLEFSFNRFFAQRVKEGVLDRDDALRESTQPDQLERLLKESL